MGSRDQKWNPEWSVPPGEILAEEIERRGISQSELARRMGRPTKTINEIVNAKTAITPETALQLEMTLGIPARLWMNLETDYRSHLARAREVETLAEKESWAKRFPLADLRKHGLIDPALKGGELVAAVLSFFGVTTVDIWENQWGDPVAAFRHSPTFRSDAAALAAWLRWGEQFAASAQTAPFDAERLRNVLVEARPMTREEPLSDVLEELQEMFAGCGVVLAMTPGLKGTAVSGAARWLGSDSALIQLSMRYRSDDHLWFTLFHEAAHLLERKREDRLDGDPSGSEGDVTDEIERRVDRRARNLLIPESHYACFVARGAFDENAVREFAATEDIAPGIVVGRLQHDGLIGPSKLAHLKKPLRWIQ